MNTRKLNRLGFALALLAGFFVAAFASAGDEKEMAYEGKRAYLGVYVESVPDLVSTQLNLDEGVGVVVQKLVPDGPAEEGGLKKHDILLRFDDQILIGTKQIVILVRNSEIGSEHEIAYIRGGKEMTATVTLGETEYKSKKKSDDQSFYQFPAPPHAAPVAPMPPAATGMSEEQLRAMEALARAQEKLTKEAEVHVMRVMNSEDFTKSMEISEEIEVLMERVNQAAQNSHNMNLPTVVFNGPERVFEFSDEQGQRFVIVEKDGMQELTVIDADGNETFNGSLDEESRKLLPEGVSKNLPEIHKMVQVNSRVWTTDGGNEMF